jgi:hypothetical protein
MKDLDESLKQNSLKPKRELSSNFTADVVEHISKEPRRRGLGLLMFNILHKPAITAAAIIAVLLLAGTSYAAVTNWPEISAKLGITKELPSGNKIIGVDTTNCNYFQVDNPPEYSQEKVYYEVKKDSALTEDQIVSMVQGICEENRANSAVDVIIKQYPSLNKLISGGIFRIDAITPNTIAVSMDKKYDPNIRLISRTTYYKLGSDIKAYDNKQPIPYSNLKVGDSVMMIARDDHVQGNSTDTDPNLWNPNTTTVLAIIKTLPLTGSPDTFFERLGTDFVRAEPCKTDPSGFCQAYDFIPDKAQN